MNSLFDSVSEAFDRVVTPAEERLYNVPEESVQSHSIYRLSQMYHEALKPFSTKTGTRYPCTRKDIDFHRRPPLIVRDRTGDMTDVGLTTDMLLQNEADKVVPPVEEKAVDRLRQTFDNIAHIGTYGPDLVIKAFNDLDLVFFGGHLRGRVRVWWSSCSANSDFRMGIAREHCRGCSYGFARKGRFFKRGEVQIVLNAALIFNGERPPLELMISTLLHEMCHAVEYVRCRHPYPPGGLSHDIHFETRVSVVHERAMRILGVGAVDEREGFRQRHWLRYSYEGLGYYHSGEVAELEGNKVQADE